MVMLNSDNINEINCYLKDEYKRDIDMRGSNYSFELVIYRERNLADKIVEGFARLMGKEDEVKRLRTKRSKRN